YCFSVYGQSAHRHLHSFPTRRSSDLPQPLSVGDDPDILALGFEDRALLDMKLEERLHLAGADLFVADPADAFQFVAEFQPLGVGDRKSTRLNSSHVKISYAAFCLKKK